MSYEMSEDQLVQETTAEHFNTTLGWQSIYAYDEETYGETGTLGRHSQREVHLTRYINQALQKYNPGLPSVAYETAIRQIIETRYEHDNIRLNSEKYELYKNGIPVQYSTADGKIEKRRLQIFDFSNPENNHFLIVRELWIERPPYRRRADIVGFVNGIPLLFIELKNVQKDIRAAYENNLKDYKDTIPHLFDSNAVIMLSNGDTALMGSISSKYEHFFEWKRLAEEDKGVVDFQNMLNGVCTKENFIDIFENYILFDESTGRLKKIVARNHQYIGVNRAFEAVRTREARKGQLGVFWHTQGSGKSYSMVFFSQKVHRKLTGNFTFLIVTDREDLDGQIYKTYAGCGVVDNDSLECRASSGKALKKLLGESDKRYIFTMIHKFNKEVEPENPYNPRSDIIVISDEAHRTQNGLLALNMRNALPNASFIGFTGTPILKDEQTTNIFGDYISTYDFQRAVEDKATVPLYYDSRGEKLGFATEEINIKIAEKLAQIEDTLDSNEKARLERDLQREYHIITAEKRLDAIARDFVEHYSTAWESGKAMFVCIDKVTAVRMYELVREYWKKRIAQAEKAVAQASDEQEEIALQNQANWLKETVMAVVISDEQGEIEKFKKWNIDIEPYRALIKNGFETPDGKKVDIDIAFKNPEHPFRVVFVCAMWLTGFDVQSLSTLYLDKPLKAHTLMQAIARANRVYEGKNNGLIVDYCGILKNLRKALSEYSGTGGDTGGGTGGVGSGSGGGGPVKPADEEPIALLALSIQEIETRLNEKGFKLSRIIDSQGFERIAAIKDAAEVLNENDQTRKTFEIQAREVFKKFKACINIKEVNNYRKQYNAIDIIYKKLQKDVELVDITDIIKQMQDIVDQHINPASADVVCDTNKVYDISNIDFEKLHKEFAKSKRKNTTVQCLKILIEKRLAKMLTNNPSRKKYSDVFNEIIKDYNQEKDRVTIEKTFESLMKFMKDLNEEEKRYVREGLQNEEQLAVYDLLVKDQIEKNDIAKIKKIAAELLDTLKKEKLKIENWRGKEATKADVQVFIHDFLWDGDRGLPSSYTNEEIEKLSETLFDHVYRQYPDADHYGVA